MANNIIKKPTPQEMAAAKLREIYVRAEREIIREITRKRELQLVDYEDVASLKRVQESLKRMTTEADEYVPKMIESYFYTAEQIASAAGGYSNALSLTVAQTSIVEQLVNNLLADIDDAAQTAFKSAENYLNFGRKEDDLFRKLALELTANKEAGVASRQTVQNMMAAELNAKGVTAFVDKAGREWSLESYCSMATRTTGRQAQVAAALTADDWDLWEIVKIGSTCPLCSAYEGRVYSKSGTDPDYPPLAMAFGKIDPAGSNDLSNTWLNLHPNCLHSLIRYTTAGKSEKQIERMKEFSSFEKRPADVDYRSKKQIEAYRNKEAERARYRADVKQFEKYKAAGVEGMPVNFETFEKHKRAGDDVYKGWESKFRSINKKGSAILNEESQIASAISEQQALFVKYGNLNNLYLTGTAEELEQWSKLSQVTNLGETELLNRLTENTKTWENVLNSQNEAALKPFTDQLQGVATQEELSALRIWSGESYADINRYMRHGDNVGRSLKNTADNIVSVLNKTSTPRDLIVRRGTGTKEIFAEMPSGWKQDPSKLIGQTYRDRGFVATSPIKSGGFSGAGETQAELFIKVPKGTKGAYIVSAAKNTDEAEFLLQRGYSYRVVNAEYVKNPLFPDENDLKVWVEVIS